MAQISTLTGDEYGRMRDWLIMNAKERGHEAARRNVFGSDTPVEKVRELLDKIIYGVPSFEERSPFEGEYAEEFSREDVILEGAEDAGLSVELAGGEVEAIEVLALGALYSRTWEESFDETAIRVGRELIRNNALARDLKETNRSVERILS